jgi:hypothetical protein
MFKVGVWHIFLSCKSHAWEVSMVLESGEVMGLYCHGVEEELAQGRGSMWESLLFLVVLGQAVNHLSHALIPVCTGYF